VQPSLAKKQAVPGRIAGRQPASDAQPPQSATPRYLKYGALTLSLGQTLGQAHVTDG
jgi:hypothetical protein